MKTFELKPVLGLLNSFTAGVRESVLEVFQQVKGGWFGSPSDHRGGGVVPGSAVPTDALSSPL